MSAADQLPMTFEHRPSMSGADFLVSTSNKDAVAWLDKWPDWPGPALVVYGPAGSGKSHLAHVFAAQANGNITTGDALDEVDIPGMEQGVLIIDDANRLTDEALLFHVFNATASAGGHLLLTADDPPSRWNISLNDLASRLRAAPAVGIDLPDDDLMAALLAKQFSDRQLRVDPAVIDYVLPRIERSFEAIKHLIEEIDRASLAQKRNVTLPFVRSVMDGMEAG